MKPIPGLDRVRAIDNEFLCFEVQSSEPDKRGPYRVDMTSWWQSGACSCIGFCGVIQPRLGKGDWSKEFRCEHIKLVHLFVAVNGARRAIEERVKLQPKYRYDPSVPNL
jgi:hypothetical protein